MIRYIKNLLGRAAQARGRSLLPRQRGAADIALLNSMMATLYALITNGFSIYSHPELVASLRSNCSNYEQFTNQASIDACASALLVAGATALRDIELQNTGAGLVLLGLSNSSGVDLHLNDYRLEFRVYDFPATDGTAQKAYVTGFDTTVYSSSPIQPTVPIAISVTGSNGYSANHQSLSGRNKPYEFSVPPAPAKTTFNFTVTAGTAGKSTTETFSNTVSAPRSYSGTYRADGDITYRATSGTNTYTCLCTLSMVGTIATTINHYINGNYNGGLSVSGARSTLSNCVGTPLGALAPPSDPNRNACYPYTGKTWTTGIPTDPKGYGSDSNGKMVWQFTESDVFCLPQIKFEGNVFLNVISGTVALANDIGGPSCTVDSIPTPFAWTRTN